MTLDEETINAHELSRFIEWAQISTAKYAANNDADLLTKFRRDIASGSPQSSRKIGVTRFDTFAVPALLEFLFPIQFSIFSPTTGLLILASYINLFLTLREKDGEPMLNPIALTVLVVTDDHVNKTV